MSGRIRHAVVIGGGFAGLSCAVELAAGGIRVTLLESRRTLGGRAGSFVDEPSGDVVDNGQHLFMACYHATRSFLERIGSADLVRFQPDLQVDYIEPGLRTRLRCPPLPAPWHLIAGTLTLKGLTTADRWSLLRAGPALRRLRSGGGGDLETITVTQWLDRLEQTPGLRRRLWHPLAIATLNESPDAAPASLLARVLIEGFGADRRLSGLGVATVGLGDLYTEAARRFIERHGGTVRVGTPAAGLRRETDRVTAVEVRDGDPLVCDAAVAAVPPQALERLGVAEPGLGRFRSSPILSINLWLDVPVTSVADFDFAAMLGGRAHWLFNKERITGGRARHLSVVISAARDLVGMGNEELAALAFDEVRRCLPAARGARLTRSLVVRERTATFAADVETEPLRPGAGTVWRNLFLAGDWTMRGLPATIEAAVRSGHDCAGRVMALAASAP